MSEDMKRELYNFLEDNYIQGNWEIIIDYIDKNFISKKDIERTEENE